MEGDWGALHLGRDRFRGLGGRFGDGGPRRHAVQSDGFRRIFPRLRQTDFSLTSCSLLLLRSCLAPVVYPNTPHTRT